MSLPRAIVVTSISAPNDILRALAGGARAHDFEFIVIGDLASPGDFQLDGCRFFSIRDQLGLGFALARACPTRHYSRKNIGYLIAIRNGARQIIETDDDNDPRDAFWRVREPKARVPVLKQAGWTNVYRYFSDANIWPRGLPLDCVQSPLAPLSSLPVEEIRCEIQQGLADENPDVDAIYRLTLALPQNFRKEPVVGLAEGSWCPFNSQNTAWFPDAYPLMYLPACCSFRVTDIWRSFVAQRIAWLNGWAILYEGPTVRQERNEHDLMKDFADEIPGYLNNRAIASRLMTLDLESGLEHIPGNMRICYRNLIEMGLVGEEEMGLLEAWLGDLAALS